jgi:hypothetical protein
VEERLLTRSTLHDELMHEAGFETDYHHDLEERRLRTRRWTIRLLGLAVYTAIATSLTVLGVPHLGGLVALLWAPLPAVMAWLEAQARYHV